MVGDGVEIDLTLARVCLESYWWEQREGTIASRGFRPCLTAAVALAANVAAQLTTWL